MFTQIDHKFLVRGHTYLPCDHDFAQIEKKKGSAVVHLPDDRDKIIKNACIANLFLTQKMETLHCYTKSSLYERKMPWATLF